VVKHTAQSDMYALNEAPEVTEQGGIQRPVADIDTLHRSEAADLHVLTPGLERRRPGKSFDLEELVDRCFIRPGCLDAILPLSRPACYAATLAKLRAFIDADPTLRDYPSPILSRHCGRAVLVAAEILGEDSHLTDEQLAQKSIYHLMMSVEIATTWLLDDALDENSTDPLYCSAVAGLFADMIRGDPVDLAERVAAIRASSSRQGIPTAHVDALLPLLRWRRSLWLALGIPHHSTSLSVKILQGFVDSLLRTHEPFHTWQAYESHRSHNSGMQILMIFSTYWNCYRWEIDPSPMECDRERFLTLLSRYGGLGGLSNDLFGYEKDVAEGVSTAVEVARRSSLDGRGDNEQRTCAAFARVIDIHNARLDELTDRAKTCSDPLEAAMFLSGLRAAWSLRALHQEYSSIYHAGWLAKALRARALGLPPVRSA